MKRILTSLVFLSLVVLPSMLFSQLKQLNSAEIRFVNEKGESVYNHPSTAPLLIEVNNHDTQQNNPDIRTLVVTIKSETEPLGETIELAETTPNSGIYRGKAILQKAAMPFGTNKKLEVNQGDRLTAYISSGDKSQGINPSLSVECWFMGPDWTFTNTGMSHIILIPSFAQITIDGEKIQPGDFISVFYEQKTGNGTILVNGGGMGYNRAPGGIKYTGETNALAIWGVQEGKNNGFAIGETLKWKIWRAKDGKYFDAVATYMSGEVDPTITDSDKYAVDGISGILSLTAKSSN
ncbi:MAG: hypothetical protein K9I34_00180 [Bacteroidales bacterium]|nr:hypothetical protein [Bacteroidales bacterium]